MRYPLLAAAALLLMLMVASCSGDSATVDTEGAAFSAFSLSDAEIDAFEASPEPGLGSLIGSSSGRLNSVPVIFADQTAEQPTSGKGASTWGWSKKCGKCKDKCGKCNHKSSCKCKGGCKQKKDKCHSCKDKCGKCKKNDDCGCKGKCKDKCKKCKDKCGKCGNDGNCGCKGKCKKPCGKCKSNCKKCKKDGNCGCSKCDCPPCPCDVKCKSIASTGAVDYTIDCETGCADATYKVHLTFTDCPGVDNEALGREVVFTRNGIEVGRASTDINGDAWLADLCLEPGTYNIKATHGKCVVCFDVCIKDKDCCTAKCTGLTSTGDTSFDMECETGCADVSYAVKLAYNDCPDVDNEVGNKEITFSRNGAVIGTAVTDASGNASFDDECLEPGIYTVTATHDTCEVEFDVTVNEVDCCEFVCTGMLNDTERFFLGDCFGTKGDVFLNVQLQFNECPGEEPVLAGHDVTFTADGQVLATVQTDDEGRAEYTWSDVALGNHHIVASSDQACATEFEVTVFEECGYHACISGKGKIAGINGSPYAVFQYEGHVQDGHLEMANTMSFSDGDISFTNTPIDWIIVLGLEIYFGSADGNLMFHTIDNGKAPGADFFEVWVFDEGYHNSGNLINGQIRSSWGLKKPPVTP